MMLVVLVACAIGAGAASADTGTGTASRASCSFSAATGTVTASCTTAAGVVYSCTLTRVVFGTWTLSCTGGQPVQSGTCTVKLFPFSATCIKES